MFVIAGRNKHRARTLALYCRALVSLYLAKENLLVSLYNWTYAFAKEPEENTEIKFFGVQESGPNSCFWHATMQKQPEAVMFSYPDDNHSAFSERNQIASTYRNAQACGVQVFFDSNA